MSNHNKPAAITLGTALAGGLVLSGSAFAVQPLAQGYLLGAQEAGQAMMKEDKAKEGKCGVDVMDTDKDGKVSRAEFDAKHMDKSERSQFDQMDANKDGFVDATEGKMHMEGSCGGDKKAGADKRGGEHKAGEGKCGEGKCGGSA
jgi:uncharacterized low-complexity protein